MLRLRGEQDEKVVSALVEKFEEFAEKHAGKIEKIEKKGPKGGSDMANVRGWTCVDGYGSILINDALFVFNKKCIKKLGLDEDRARCHESFGTLLFWGKGAKYPKVAVPVCMYEDICDAFDDIVEKAGKDS